MNIRSKFSVVAAGALLLGLGAVACDDADDDDLLNGDETPGISDGTPDSGNETPATSPTTDGGSPEGDDTPGSGQGGGGAENLVEISEDAPGESLTVSAGTSVTFINNSQDPVTLTIESEDGDSEESDEIEPGDQWDHTFDDEGEYMVSSDDLPSFMVTVSVN